MSGKYPENGYRDPDSFDVQGSLKQIAEATRRYRGVVLLSCVLCLGLAFAYAHLFPPIYVANAKAIAEKGVDNSRDNFYAMWDVFRKDDPRGEIEMMLAPSMIAKVVQKEGLKYDDVYHPFLSHLTYLWQSSLPGKTYHRLKDSLFPQKPDPDAPSLESIELGKTVGDMRSGVAMVPVPDTEVGELTVKGPSRRVAKMANTLLEVYLAERAERYREEAQKNLDALDQEVAVAAKNAQDIATRRLEFAQTNHLAFDFTKESQQMTKMVDLEDSIASNEAKIASLSASLHEVEGQLNKEPVSKTTSTMEETNGVRESSRLKRLDLQTQLIQLRSIYREDSPEVQEVLHNIVALDKIIAAEPERMEKATTTSLNSIRQDLTLSSVSMRSQLAGAKAGEAVMQETDRKLRARMSAVPELQNTMRDFDRQYAMASDLYQALSTKRAQAAISRAMAVTAAPSMRVFQWASPPAEPVWPKLKILYPSALLIGLVLGVLGAQIRSLMSGRVHAAALSRSRASDAVYGTIRVPVGTQPFTVVGARKTAENGRGKD